MQFNSVDFMFFFPFVVFVWFVVPKKLRTMWLLGASYYFYMGWNPIYALLIGFSTLVTFLCGLGIDTYRESEHSKKRKIIILILGLSINLFILIIFKYGNFIIETIDSIMQTLNIGQVDKRLNILLPVGISFYTFQALGYVIDVYRGEVKAEKNIFRYALFVSFFPQLVAGPIERSKNLLNQMKNIDKINIWNFNRVASGAIQMAWGYFMKMVIADRVAILVDTVYNNWQMYGATELVLASAGFSLQIYCDFASYSLIAIGAAKIMGFSLMENFNTPYFARSIRDFWGRWHISLSTWFKDYLYIPLGGNRKGKVRKLCNLFIVFLVSGLWHGASWTFVIWGALHGAYQVIGDVLKPHKEKLINKCKIKTDCFSWKFLQTLITFSLVTFAWIFFRANSVSDAFGIVERIFTRPTPWLLFNGGIYNLGLDRIEMNILIVSVVVLFVISLVKYIYNQTIDVFLMRQNLWFEWLVVISLIVSIFVFGKYGPSFDAQQFIYFQF